MEPHCRHETTLCPHSCLSVPVPTSSVFRNTVTQGSSMHHRRSSPLQDSFGRCSLLEGGKSGPTALRPQGRVLALAPGHGAKKEEGLWLVKSDSSSTPRFLTLMTGTLPVLGFNHGENTHLRQHHGVKSRLHPTLMKNTGHTIKRATQTHQQQLSSQPTTLATVPTITTPPLPQLVLYWPSLSPLMDTNKIMQGWI